MSKQKLEKKVLVLQGNMVETGQTLTNIFGMNPEFEIIQKFEFTGARLIPTPTIAVPGQPQQTEMVMIIFMVYTNPGDLVGLGDPSQMTPVKANIKAKEVN